MNLMSDERSKIYRTRFNPNFFSTLSNLQMNKLKMSLEMQLNNSVSHSTINQTSCIKIVCENSLAKIKNMQKANNSLSSNNRENVRLIGKAGYDEIFDDEVFNREKKIKSIDYQIEDILKIERAMVRSSPPYENTLVELNFER